MYLVPMTTRKPYKIRQWMIASPVRPHKVRYEIKVYPEYQYTKH